MKPTHLIGIVIVVMILGGILLNTSTEVRSDAQIETRTIEVEKEVTTLDIRIRDAIDAAQGELEAAAQLAYDESMSKGMLDIKTRVTDEYLTEVVQENEADKELLLKF